MIPKKMEKFLKKNLPEPTFKNRLLKKEGKCFLEFTHNDEHLLSRIGIVVDKLGPEKVVCMWDCDSPEEIGGYLVVDNLSMGKPSMGGIRMLPDLKPIDIYNLARGMTLKNAAANLPYGGGKAGIVSRRDLSQEEHENVIRGFAKLIRPYKEIYVPGPDVGTKDADMKTIAIMNGLDSAVSKTADMGGNRIDELGGAAGGVVIALQTLLEIMPRLRILPQFSNLEIPDVEELNIILQGFGAVGAHAARIFKNRLPEAKIVGVSDIEGYLFNKNGLPIEKLFKLWKEHGLISTTYFKREIEPNMSGHPTHFSTDPNSLLMQDSFCMVPAAPVFNYLGVRKSENPSITVDKMGDWSVIVEGANTYSPDPNRKAARIRMEQEVYRKKGIMIANDYLVNSGGVIFAAQEHLVKTPEHLQIPEDILGNKEAVNEWLEDHADEFAELSKKRLIEAKKWREEVIHHNMIELVDLLTSNPDLLPSNAAEKISVQRLAAREKERTAKDIMIDIPTIDVAGNIQDAASLIINNPSNMVAVLSEDKLVGVITSHDITNLISKSLNLSEVHLEEIMTKDVVSASPAFSIIDIVRELEQYEISTLPVVQEGRVLGLVSADLIARRYVQELSKESI
ncbi:MAG: Glutamate dehydrogenase (NAD(P)(+)) [Promethearchaeota archaeon]|nr:MAG: Glutamate dehydrogenase (NAD(P)(+)) [Candidatus Lokiarchaeota archaeon]